MLAHAFIMGITLKMIILEKRVFVVPSVVLPWHQQNTNEELWFNFEATHHTQEWPHWAPSRRYT